MAKFTFELTDKRYFYSATKDKSMQRFMFASKVASGYTVEIKNNGQLATGDVTFFEIGDDSSKIYQGKISYGERTKNEPHIFSVNAYLPTTIF